MPDGRFRLDPFLAQFVPRPLASLLAPPLEIALALRRCERVCAQIPAAASPAAFAAAALELLNARFTIDVGSASVPESGPLVVVANHPYGGLEGLYLYSVLAARRPDARLLGNRLLAQLPGFEPAVLPVDVFGGAPAARRNAAAMRDAVRFLSAGGALLVFPAGQVATVDAATRTLADPAWHPSVARLVRLTGARVLPVFVDGGNSVLFHLAGLVHPRLRTALLPRELFNKRGRTIAVTIGAPVDAAQLASLGDDAAICDHLRLRVYALACATGAAGRRRPARRPATTAPLAAPVPGERLADELARLDRAQRVAAHGDLEVWHATQSQAPWVMQEIGRLRELTFRTVGEGTGGERDVDLYDSYYEQLFVWHRVRREVVGGYRLGLADRICARFGPRGLYTHTLFNFRRPLLTALGPALELGRSFVRPEYQKEFAPLLLLWRAIGAYVVAHPTYRVLFGPVSISNDYSSASRALITGFLDAQSRDRRPRVRARNPLPVSGGARLVRREAAELGKLDALEAVVASLEPDGKGVPVLLRQYLKLGARVLGFNVDPAFGNSIDVLVAVDLTRTDRRVLAKYMGAEGAERFLGAQHGWRRPKLGARVARVMRSR